MLEHPTKNSVPTPCELDERASVVPRAEKRSTCWMSAELKLSSLRGALVSWTCRVESEEVSSK